MQDSQDATTHLENYILYPVRKAKALSPKLPRNASVASSCSSPSDISVQGKHADLLPHESQDSGSSHYGVRLPNT